MGYKEQNDKQWARKHNTENNKLINTNPREKSSALETVRVITFSQFSGCWLILSVYILMSFDFPFVRLFGVR
jgi:hypothetical protein